MLTMTMNHEAGVLEVREDTLSFHGIRTCFWYYDTRKWLKSSHGKAGDTPDRVMTTEDIQLVKQVYLPQVQQPVALVA